MSFSKHLSFMPDLNNVQVLAYSQIIYNENSEPCLSYTCPSLIGLPVISPQNGFTPKMNLQNVR